MSNGRSETAIEPITRTTYEGKGYRCGTTTFFVRSIRVLLALLEEREFRVLETVELGERAVVLVRTSSAR